MRKTFVRHASFRSTLSIFAVGMLANTSQAANLGTPLHRLLNESALQPRQGSPCTGGSATSPVTPVMMGPPAAPYDPVSSASVRIVWQDPSSQKQVQCTGVLVDKDVVLTAAHCVADRGENFRLYFAGNQQGVSDHVLIHPDAQVDSLSAFFGLGANDLALIHIRRDDSLLLSPPPLFKDDHVLKNGWDVKLAGFGRPEPSKHADTVLRIAPAHLEPFSGDDREITVTQGGACIGDSGGGMFVLDAHGQYWLAGILSYLPGFDCSSKAHYSRVAAYSSWIQQGVQTLRAQSRSQSH